MEIKGDRSSNKFIENLKRDWGKEDVFGPWTKDDGKVLKFYKSYYLITDDKETNINLLKENGK